MKIVNDPPEIAHVGELMLARFPQVKAMLELDLSGVAFLKITPNVNLGPGLRQGLWSHPARDAVTAACLVRATGGRPKRYLAQARAGRPGAPRASGALRAECLRPKPLIKPGKRRPHLI